MKINYNPKNNRRDTFKIGNHVLKPGANEISDSFSDDRAVNLLINSGLITLEAVVKEVVEEVKEVKPKATRTRAKATKKTEEVI